MDHPSGSERGTETQQGTLHLHCAPDYPLDGSPASLGCRQGQWEESRFSDKEPRAQAQFTELPKITWLVSEVPRLLSLPVHAGSLGSQFVTFGS